MTEIKSQNKDALLNALFGSIVDDIEKSAQEKVDKLQERIESKMQKLDSVLSSAPITINLGTVEKPKNEVTHKRFNDIINILQSAKRKEKNIMLVGGAGGGKTHLCKQVADALKLDFYPFSVGLQTTKSDLMGFINATGVYVSSPIRKAYENGGVLLLDEFDAAHAGVVTILNSLLANGETSFPDKIVTKNEKFICICACNTYGKGANIDYIGRNRLDGATLDRFIVLDVDYDNDLEKLLTRNAKWSKVVSKIRDNIEKQGIKMIVSPRASMDGADLLDAGFEPERVVEMVIYKGCDDDIKNKIMKGVDLSKLKEERKEKKEREELKEIQQVAVRDKEDSEFENELRLDFDDFKYSLKIGDKKLLGMTYALGDFTLHFGDTGTFSTYLSIDQLYINQTDGAYVLFDERIMTKDSDIEHFLHTLGEAVHGHGINIKVDVRYKTTTYGFILEE